MKINVAVALLVLTLSLPTFGKPVGTTFFNFGGLSEWNQVQRNEKLLAHRWWADLSVGYTPLEFLSVGLLYTIDQAKVTTTGYSLSSDNYESRDYRTSWGPQIHLWFEPFYLAASYYLDSKLTSELTTDGLSPYKYEGTGLSIELGFLYAPSESVQFSISAMYRNWKHPTRTQNGGGTTTLSPPRDETRLDPSLKVWLFF
jgi:hypothetical protein